MLLGKTGYELIEKLRLEGCIFQRQKDNALPMVGADNDNNEPTYSPSSYHFLVPS